MKTKLFEGINPDDYIESDYGFIHVDDVAYLREEYNKILLKLKKLAEELKTTNALDASTLFSVLLLKGYLSVNKTHNFDSKDRIFINDLHALDVIKGNSVCLDNSEMHTDFLNICGFNATIFSCTANKLIGTEKFTEWYSDIINYKGNYNVLKRFLSWLFTNNNAHTVTLINEGEFFYLYDVTNKEIIKINNLKISKAIKDNLLYANELNDSYNYVRRIENKVLLDSLKKTKEFLCPYNYEQFVKRNNEICRRIVDNQNIIDDYYSDAVSNINNINEEIVKIKR